MFVSHLPEKARVVDDGSVDDGAGQHGEERHEDGLEAEGERLVSHLDAAQGNQNIANPAQFIEGGLMGPEILSTCQWRKGWRQFQQ